MLEAFDANTSASARRVNPNAHVLCDEDLAGRHSCLIDGWFSYCGKDVQVNDCPYGGKFTSTTTYIVPVGRDRYRWWIEIGTQQTPARYSSGEAIVEIWHRTSDGGKIDASGFISGYDVKAGSDVRCSTDLGVQDGAVVGGNCTVTTSDGKSYVCDRGYFDAPDNDTRARYFEGCR